MKKEEKGFVNILVGLVIVIGIVIWAVSAGSDKAVEDTSVVDSSNTVEEKDMMEKDGEEMMDKEDDMMDIAIDAEVASSAGFFKDYESMDMLANGPENQVLFFHASWCPSCRALESDISNSDIPADLGIYKLDFDNSSDLKAKYGVTSQHTLVQVDSEGNLITKWLGGNDLDSVVSKLQ